MPFHMSRTRMAAETIARLARYPENRMAASKDGVKDFGGEMIGYFYSTGRSDIISLSWVPDPIAACALETTIYGSGALLDYDHVWLLSVEEMTEAARKSKEWPSMRDYRPPGAAGEEMARLNSTGEV